MNEDEDEELFMFGVLFLNFFDDDDDKILMEKKKKSYTRSLMS